jgi:ubiquinol oxidase
MPLALPPGMPLTTTKAARRPGFLARSLFATMDAVYGRSLTLERFAALELVARVPYQAWENVAYTAITHVSRRPSFARRIFEFVLEARAAQDNEQWHLLILEELVEQRGVRRSLWKARIVPQILALFYYHVSWLLYVVSPRSSYALNADFEDHAEHGYLAYVEQHPELEQLPWSSAFAADYGQHATVADLLRRIASDEATHAAHSRARLLAPRFENERPRIADGLTPRAP